MNQEIKAQWLQALRSGEYRQGQQVLQYVNGGYCCLGVLCELAVKAGKAAKTPTDSGNYMFSVGDNDASTGVLPEGVKEWAGLISSNPAVRYLNDEYCLSALNDAIPLDFRQIADLIEAQL